MFGGVSVSSLLYAIQGLPPELLFEFEAAELENTILYYTILYYAMLYYTILD